MQRTIVILKPDAVMRGLVGEITTRFEKKGLKIAGSKLGLLSTEVLREHYAHLVEKPFFPSILAYMQSGPVQMMCLEGKDAVTIVRTMIGTTNPVQAAFGTIRGDYAMHISKNCIHASENEDEAAVEVKRFFKTEELFEYTSGAEANLYE